MATGSDVGMGACTIASITLSATPFVLACCRAFGEVLKLDEVDLILATRTSGGSPALVMLMISLFVTASVDAALIGATDVIEASVFGTGCSALFKDNGSTDSGSRCGDRNWLLLNSLAYLCGGALNIAAVYISQWLGFASQLHMAPLNPQRFNLNQNCDVNPSRQDGNHTAGGGRVYIDFYVV